MRTAEDILTEKGGSLIAISPDSSVFEAATVMTENNIGSILIEKNGKIIGIWTERDLLHNLTVPDFDYRKDKISKYMSKTLYSAPHNATPYQLKDKFLGKRIRRLLIEKDNQYIGIVSIGDVVRACLIEKDDELRKLDSMIKWDYYENWRWEKKKGKI